MSGTVIYVSMILDPRFIPHDGARVKSRTLSSAIMLHLSFFECSYLGLICQYGFIFGTFMPGGVL